MCVAAGIGGGFVGGVNVSVADSVCTVYLSVDKCYEATTHSAQASYRPETTSCDFATPAPPLKVDS